MDRTDYVDQTERLMPRAFELFILSLICFLRESIFQKVDVNHGQITDIMSYSKILAIADS